MSTEILLQLQDGEKRFGGRTLFTQAYMTVNHGEHIGLIGPNGAGKSTLLKALIDPATLDRGQVSKSTSLRMGYLAQEDSAVPAMTTREYLSQSSLPWWEVEEFARQLGLLAEHLEQPLADLSGGLRMRAKLLLLISQDNQLLLLDEPTNYLDLESLLTLEKFLQEFTGAFVLVSHDREFLRRTTDHIIEVETGEITKFNGNIDDYFEQKELLAESLRRQALAQDAKAKAIQSFAERFRAKATKARQVQSRLRQLEKMEKIELRALPVTAKIRVPQPTPIGRFAVQLSQAQLGYEQNVILDQVSLQIERGDHIGVVGVNGAGKSTLLKTLAQQTPLLSGQLEWGLNAHTAYFAQHVAKALNPEYSVYQALESAAHTDVLPQDIKDLAGGLLFQGDDIHKKISVLSGGEKSRVALGQVLLKKQPILLLDEPTNHLDFHTVEALTQALSSYSGTLVVVSHDRSFIGRVANKILEIRDGRVDLYPGTYDEYVWSLEKGAWQSKNIAPPSAVTQCNPNPNTCVNPTSKPTSVDRKKQIRILRLKLSTADKQLATLSSEISAITLALSQPSGQNIAELATNLRHKQNYLLELEDQWLSLTADLEQLETGV